MNKPENVIGYKLKLKNRRVALRRAEIDGEICWQLETKSLQPNREIYRVCNTYSDEAFLAIAYLFAKISEEAESAIK